MGDTVSAALTRGERIEINLLDTIVPISEPLNPDPRCTPPPEYNGSDDVDEFPVIVSWKRLR